MKEMLVMVSRLCGVRKSKWRNEMFLTEVLHVQELKSHVSQKETAIGYAGIWPWRMMLV